MRIYEAYKSSHTRTHKLKCIHQKLSELGIYLRPVVYFCFNALHIPWANKQGTGIYTGIAIIQGNYMEI